MRTLLVALVLVVVGGPGGHASAAGRDSHVTLAAFTLRSDGIALTLHPTEAPIVVVAVADGAVKVCEVGTTFAGAWHGGCRRVGSAAVSLPASNGAVHVGLRILPAAGRAVRVARLTVRWHCVDHAYLLERASTAVRRATPAFDCL